MNKTIETIMKRKGTSSYTSQQVHESDMDTIITAGIAGPTGRNLQNRHFTVDVSSPSHFGRSWLVVDTISRFKYVNLHL
jgi:hypothetical protein